MKGNKNAINSSYDPAAASLCHSGSGRKIIKNKEVKKYDRLEKAGIRKRGPDQGKMEVKK